MHKSESTLCPVTCPFLGMRSFLPQTMPFYCNKYGTFLGMTPAKKVLRANLCMGEQVDIVTTGLALLEVQSTRVADLKAAFLKMKPSDQMRLTGLLLKNGIQLNFEKTQTITPVLLLSEVLHQTQGKYRHQNTAEVQEFIKLLSLLGSDDAPLNSSTQNLLSNLFQVLDSSEKAMLLAVLENPARLKSFLKQFSKIKQNDSMLKNFRALLYDFDRQRQIQNPTASLVVSGHLQHLLKLMNRVRTPTRQRD